jgi:hypothetical protein
MCEDNSSSLLNGDDPAASQSNVGIACNGPNISHWMVFFKYYVVPLNNKLLLLCKTVHGRFAKK